MGSADQSAARVTAGPGRPVAPAPGLRQLAGRAAPVALAGDQMVAVAPALAPLFPGGGLRRGSVVGVAGSAPGAGTTSLTLALLAGPSAAGSWTAVVGVPGLSGLAAAEAGVDLARLALVPRPGPGWPTVVAALLDALDVVAVAPPGRVRPADARRLVARCRERGSVLVVVGAWPEGPDVRLAPAGTVWRGLGRGHGALSGRRLEVAGGGRGAAARARGVTLDLARPVPPGPPGPPGGRGRR